MRITRPPLALRPSPSRAGRVRRAARRRRCSATTTVSTIAMPGDDRQPRRGLDPVSPSAIRLPHDGCGGWTPAPRNESAGLDEDVGRDDQREEDEHRRTRCSGGSPPNMIRSGPAPWARRRLDELLLAQRQDLAAQRPADVRDRARRRSRASGSRDCPPLMLIGSPELWWKPLTDSAVPSAIASRITGNAQIRSKKREITQSVEPP